MLAVLVLSWGTPSNNVVIEGLAGLAPMPLNRALLNFLAVNSLNCRFGPYLPESLTNTNPAFCSVGFATVVRLRGSDCASAGSFCAVTMTGGSWKVAAG